MKKRTITILILLPITILILYFPINNSLSNSIYNYDNFKNSLISEYENNPEEFNQNFQFKINNIEEINDDVVNELYSKAIYYKNVYSFSIAAILAIFIDFLLSFIILYIPSIANKYQKYQNYINDFHKNKDYYREILKNYSPVELSIVLNNNVSIPSIVANLLTLEKEKIIANNNGAIVSNIDKNDFSNDFMKNIFINNGKVDVYYLNMSKYAKDKAIKDNLVEKASFPKKKFIIDILLSIGFYLIPILYVNNFTLFGNMILNYSDNILIVISLFTMLIISIIILFTFPLFTIIKYIILYGILKNNNYKRTTLGNEINNKLQGLNNFIKDFSNLDERDKKELVLWEDYLIYSVLFKNNKKIYREYRKRISFK